MANNNQSVAADDVAAEFIGSLFAGDASATADPIPVPAPSEKSAKAEQIVTVPISELEPFPAHPFQIRDDDEMASLVESIKDYGVLTPLTARNKDDGRYVLVSGHRRKHACELAGIKELPVVVREMTPEQAVVAMADSNLQREKILPSEKAWAYKLKLDAKIAKLRDEITEIENQDASLDEFLALVRKQTQIKKLTKSLVN